ncbi:MAG: hydrogenobyrinic acid a,c-diamide synthase (glutamine-hydrolyzing) [Gammaproteobacteria bacterium]|jgi:cobyrinic acid a,c-diamide synthase
MNRLLLSAAHKSSGKTTVTLGLCAAWAAGGLKVQAFKKGPDYIDPMWLSRAARRPCHNLDFYTMGRSEILATVGRFGADSDIALVEGNKGLYDGLDLDGSNSNAALAKLLQAPVVLVLDARGMTRGIAPLILGYQAFDPDVRIAGVILNQLGGRRHESKLRAVIEHYTDVPVVGAVHRDPELQIVERHLGLIPENEAEAALAMVDRIGRRIASQVDLERLLELARSAPPLEEHAPLPIESAPDQPPVRIGVARDAAFGFYYPGDLMALERAGAQIVPIDMLAADALPDIDGLFIGGGFPETKMAELEANAALRAQIKSAIDNGLPVYAECGGLMYLCRTLSWGDRQCRMVGAIAADAVMCERPQGRGYVQLEETGESPWAAAEQERIAAHEFHYSRLENLPPDTRFAYRVVRGTGVDGSHDGIVYRNLLACYAHMRDVQNNHWAARFVQFVRRCVQNASDAPADIEPPPDPSSNQRQYGVVNPS